MLFAFLAASYSFICLARVASRRLRSFCYSRISCFSSRSGSANESARSESSSSIWPRECNCMKRRCFSSAIWVISAAVEEV
jgi:hypothetical protein